MDSSSKKWLVIVATPLLLFAFILFLMDVTFGGYAFLLALLIIAVLALIAYICDKASNNGWRL